MPLSARLPALSALAALALTWLNPTPARAETAAPAEPLAALLCADGRLAEGSPHLSDANALAVGSCTCALDRIIDLSLPGETMGTIDQGAVLADGTVLRGFAVHVEAGKLLLRSDALGDLTIDQGLISAIAVGPFHACQARELAAGPVGVRFPDGERFDGPIDYLNIKEVGIDAGTRVRRYPRSKLSAVVLAPVVTGAGTWIQLAGGDLLCGTITAWAGDHLILASSLKANLTIPLAAVRALWSVSPNMQALDALKGTEVDVPLPAIVAPAVLGPLPPSRRLRSGLRHGIISCAGSTLRFDQVAGWAMLTGEVQAAEGCRGVSCTIAADGQQLFTSGVMNEGDAPKPFSVKVSGAHSLSLLTTCTPEAGTGSVVWRWPTLSK